MSFTNKEKSLWHNLPPDYEAVKDRFMFFEFDYCNYDTVVSYLRLMYKKLDEYTNDNKHEYETTFKLIPIDIKISYRKLKQLCVSSLYKLSTIVNKLQYYQDNSFVTNIKDEDFQSNLDLELLSCDNNNNNDPDDNKVNDELKQVTIPKQTTVGNTVPTKDKDKIVTLNTNNNDGDKRGGIKLLPLSLVTDVDGDDDGLGMFKVINDCDLCIRRATELEYKQLKNIVFNSAIDNVKVGVDYDQQIVRAYDYYPSGNLAAVKDVILYFEYYSPYGKSVYYYDSKQLKSNGYYKHAAKVGKYKSWYENGKLEHESNYDQKGTLNGYCLMYDNYGGKYEYNYVDGKKQGLQTAYYATGDKESETNYVNNITHGPHITYYENGKLKYTSENYNSMIHGLCTDYYDNGNKSRERNFNRGVKDGIERTWDFDGNETTV